jgi:copper chaperone CopZ
LSVRVERQPGRAVVKYDASRITPRDVARAIERAGYHATPP